MHLLEKLITSILQVLVLHLEAPVLLVEFEEFLEVIVVNCGLHEAEGVLEVLQGEGPDVRDVYVLDIFDRAKRDHGGFCRQGFEVSSRVALGHLDQFIDGCLV